MRLIDADAFIKEINYRCESEIKRGINAIADHNEGIKIRAEQAISTFCEASLIAKLMPTIDAVEVVRCKDCKHITEHDFADGNIAYWTCSVWDSGTNYDGYCHYGERKEE